MPYNNMDPQLKLATCRQASSVSTFPPLETRRRNLWKSVNLSPLTTFHRDSRKTINSNRISLAPRKASFLPQIPDAKLLPHITEVYFSSQVGSWKGFPKRFNQDYYFDMPKDQSRLFGVCDGYGKSGHIIAQLTAKSLPTFLFRHVAQRKAASTSSTLIESFAECSQLLQESSIDTTGSGSTCLALLEVDQTVVCASVGDSRAVVGRKKRGIWTVYQLTWDYKGDSSRDSREETSILIKPQQNFSQQYLNSKGVMSSTRSLSQLSFISTNSSSSSPTIDVCTLTPVDRFVLIATRGLWEVMDSIEAVRLAGSMYETQVETVPEMLAREAQRRWKERGLFVEDVTVGLAVISP